MTMDSAEPKPGDFRLLEGGPYFRLDQFLSAFGLVHSRRWVKILLIIVITWVMPLLLSMASGRALRGQVAVPFLHDPAAYCRFLIVIPLLELAELVVALSLAAQARQFVASGIVPEAEWPRFESTIESTVGSARSVAVEGVLVALSFTLAYALRFVVFRNEISSWAQEGTAITLAGWWYIVVSLPILLWFLLRWLWVFLLWASFLFRVSRLELELVPTHPDRAGGLGFLGWGIVSFSSILVAVSTIFSGGFLYEIIHHGGSLDTFKYHLTVIVVIALVALHAPLLSFSGKLARCRFKGLLEFGALVWHYDHAFEEKWMRNPEQAIRDDFLGSSDIQSMVDIATGYRHIEEMRLIPFDFKATIVLALSALVPFVPLLWATLPMSEIFAKLVELAA